MSRVLCAIKYRAACDHCSAMKVRCTQQRPSCARCHASGVPCHYSRSRRRGKPPRSVTNAKRDEMQQRQPHPPADSTNDDAKSGASTTSSTLPRDADWLYDVHFDEADLIRLIQDEDDDARSGEPHDTTDQLDDVECTPSAADAAPAVQSPTHEQEDRCIQLALETLSDLHDMGPVLQHTSASAHRPSVDQVLIAMERGVQCCQALVSCRCSHDFHYPILIAAVVGRIIAWYQAVAGVQSAHTASPGGKSHRVQEMQEVVVESQATLGAFQLDGDMRRVLTLQIVLGHLQRLEQVVERYTLRYCGEGGSGGRLYAGWGRFLKGEVQFTLERASRGGERAKEAGGVGWQS